jgi:hypothetical protein
MDTLKQFHLTLDDLPAWMRPRKRGFDWVFIGFFAFSLLLLAPLMLDDVGPVAPSAQAEIYRITILSQTVGNGQLYPRWAWIFNAGTGAPTLSHIAPLPHILGTLHHGLVQTEPITSFRFTLVWGVLIGGLGVMVFVRRRWGISAGVMAGGLYLLSPYVMFGLYLRPDAGLLWATGLLPLALWLADHLLQDGQGIHFVLFGAISAMLLLAEADTGLILFGMVIVWVGWGIWVEKQWQYASWAGWALVLAGAISLIYYAPALNTMNQVALAPTARWQPDWQPYQETMPLPVYPAQVWREGVVNTTTPLYIGLAQTLAGLGGGVWLMWRLLRKNASHRGQFAPLLIWCAVAVWSSQVVGQGSLISQAFYLNPIDPFDNLDRLGLLTLSLSLLGGVGLGTLWDYLRNQTPRLVLIGLGIGGLLILGWASWPLALAPRFGESYQREFTLETYLAWEAQTGWYSTLPNGLVYPAEASVAEWQLIMSEGGVLGINRQLARVEGVQIVNARLKADDVQVLIDVPQPESLTLTTFPDAGIRIRHAGRRIHPVILPNGVYQFVIALHSGQNLVTMDYVFTDLQWFSMGLSLTAWVMLILLGYALHGLHQTERS